MVSCLIIRNAHLMKKDILTESIKQVIAESTKVNFGGHKFLMKIDTNEDPQKKGVKIIFYPLEFGSMNSTTQNDIAIELESRLEAGLAEYGLRVERDRAIKDRTAIAYFIYVEYFDRIIRKALMSQNPNDKHGVEDAKDSAAFGKEPNIK